MPGDSTTWKPAASFALMAAAESDARATKTSEKSTTLSMPKSYPFRSFRTRGTMRE